MTKSLGPCGCVNGRRGTPKQMHKSQAAALKQLSTRRYADGLPHYIYKCPNRSGVWHIATRRKK